MNDSTLEPNTAPSNVYDGIILGAGHNSLILQSYLGRAGLRVLCIERRDHAGGGLETIEDPRQPGFLHNTHSFYHRGVTGLPWYRDLGLAAFGAHYVEPELNVVLLLKNGETLEWWTDFEQTFESFARLNRQDAAALRRWRDEFQPIVENILVPENQSPPLPPDQRRALLGKSVWGRRLLDVSALTPLEFVKSEFQHPAIQAGLLFFNGLREVDLRCPGFGHHIPALLASKGKAQMCLGGSASLARALVASVRSSGGEIRLQIEPKRILVENGRAIGVETTNGEIFHARSFVASALNPQQTFLELLDEKILPAEWRTRAEKFAYNLVAPLFGLYLNLSESPQYRAADKHPEIQNALMFILGLDHVDQFLEIIRHHEARTIPPTVMWGSSPSHFDPTQAPQGHHTAFMWEKLPYPLQGNPKNWDHDKDPHGMQMLDVWNEYAPNVRESIVSWFTRSPLDTERTLHNMKYGDLLVGAFMDGQVGYNRPFPGAGQYRGFLEGLYLCGSSCHPGGNITGLPGYNSAQVILSDLGLAAPWAPMDISERLKNLG